MEGLSVWSAQALQSLDRDGSLKVKYCQSSREVLEEVQHDGPVTFRVTGDLKYYYPDDPNASPSRLYSGSFEAMPRPAPYRQHEGEPHYLKVKEKIPQEKPPYDITMLLPPFFDDPRQRPLDPHVGLQRRIDTIEAFLSKKFPYWKKFLESFQSGRNPIVQKPGKPTGDIDPDAEGLAYKYALVYGETTEFNPSGIWVVEEFYNNDDM